MTLRSLLVILPLVSLLVGCGGENAISGPSPTPSPASWSGTVTDTVTGAPVIGWSAAIRQPGRVTLSAPGYVTRETRTSATTVDLIPEAGFDLGFYRQLARGAQEGRMDPLRVLSQAPSIYLQSTALKPSTVAAYEQAARAVIPALTGGRLSLAAWETGSEARALQAGWIMVELINDETKSCGEALIGAAAGQMWINTATKCHRNGDIVGTPTLFAHELGHALGFWHVERSDALMAPLLSRPVSLPTDIERQHAAIAYARRAGNEDLDRDALTTTVLSAVTIQ
jgi:Matrixin